MNSLHHMKEYPKISNFLQFESHCSKCVKVRATLKDLRDLYGNSQGLTSFAFNQYFLHKNQSCKLQKLGLRLVRPWILFPYKP